jgi:hypothetical protein
VDAEPLVIECLEPRPFHEHVHLTVSLFLMALAAIRHLLLHTLGWCLRNRWLILWVCGVCYEIGQACLAVFGWVTVVGLVAQHLLGVDLGIAK